MKRNQLSILLLIIASLTISGCETTQIADLGNLFGSAGLNESTVVAGLKEALRVGTERSSGSLSESGGFSGNPLLRLALPQELDDLAKGMRAIGMGSQVDKLEATMNDAAEQAAGEAIPVFASAISKMTVKDAMNILNGESDAATQYFRKATSEDLRKRFAPVVDDAINKVGLSRNYQDVVKKYNAIPFSKPVAPDLQEHVTQKTLDGLFKTLADEEARIRADPAARSTELLRKVFGNRG